ncbi:MAG: YbaK/prolyl-tRNA synthetase associated domain-containing protein [Formosimonas sp.]
MFHRLHDLLTREQARFRVIEHPAEGVSDKVAQIRGTHPAQGAKAMLCTLKGAATDYVLAILSGDARLDFKKVAAVMQAKKASLASPEQAMAQTGCVIGAIPPFSFDANLPLIVDAALLNRFDEIAFNAGRLDASMVLSSTDYLRIAAPILVTITA